MQGLLLGLAGCHPHGYWTSSCHKAPLILAGAPWPGQALSSRGIQLAPTVHSSGGCQAAPPVLNCRLVGFPLPQPPRPPWLGNEVSWSLFPTAVGGVENDLRGWGDWEAWGSSEGVLGGWAGGVLGGKTTLKHVPRDPGFCEGHSHRSSSGDPLPLWLGPSPWALTEA